MLISGSVVFSTKILHLIPAEEVCLQGSLRALNFEDDLYF